MDSATAGLIGVFVGAGITTLVKWIEHAYRKTQATRYLVARVAPQLQRFVVACAKVAVDSGEMHPSGQRFAMTVAPAFAPDVLDVDWKALPPPLMYSIWNLPARLEFGESYLDAVSDNSSPDDGSYLQERRLLYATLGLEANEMLTQLLGHGKFPQQPIDHWDPVDVMKRARAEIEALVTGWQAQNAAMMKSAPPLPPRPPAA